MEKMNALWVFMCMALVAGLLIPFQAAMNAGLGKNLGSPYWASLVVFVVAFVAMLLYAMIIRNPAPTASLYAQPSWWMYLGGLLGAGYILMSMIAAGKLGIGNVTVLILTGQMLAALFIDHFGWLNTPVHAMNLARLAGTALVLGGAYLVNKY
jgi:transporter family-2 protein